MYFAVIGNFPEITLAELQMVQAKNIQKVWAHILVFDTKNEPLLQNMASLVKWWKIISQPDFWWYLEWKKILWMADENLAVKLKKQYDIKRYKKVDILHTDLDVKKKGIELIKIWAEWGIVLWYQNIKLYELADFDKPGRSMQMWMMPAKLTHTMINIAISNTQTDNAKLIFDPFCWTWTTWIISNYLWYVLRTHHHPQKRPCPQNHPRQSWLCRTCRHQRQDTGILSYHPICKSAPQAHWNHLRSGLQAQPEQSRVHGYRTQQEAVLPPIIL